MMRTALLLFALLVAPVASAGGLPPSKSAALLEPTEAMLRDLRAAISRYADFSVAEAEGWQPFGGEEPLMGRHYHLGENGPDYAGPDTVPDPTRPSNLMYSTIDGEQVLTGVAFGIRIAPDEPLPEGFPGHADIWHVHDIPEIFAAATAERPVLRWLGGLWLEHRFKGTADGRDRLAMVHVWATLDNPDGVFAHYNRLVPYLKHGLPPQFADSASEAAARGLALAAPEGCENSFEGRLWIAQAERWQRKAIMAACAREAEAVAAAVAACGPDGADWLNAIAEAAWQRLDTTFRQIATPEQQRRLASIVEHGDAHAAGGSSAWQLPDDARVPGSHGH
ncbi:MAG: hypothetical protein AAF416_18225 [Pseudomonadota bacterium]